MKRLDKYFFKRDTLTIARELIGQYLVREINGQKAIVMITETEAYIGRIDKACHAYGLKITERTRILYEEGSSIYVYLIYGMYYCLNIVTEEKGEPSCVLIRGAEIFQNTNLLSQNRYSKPFNALNNYQKKNFLNGPGKLCKALNIDKSLNGKSVLGNELYILQNENFDINNVKTGKRINIDYAQEATHFLWRFYI